jgi:hypothetical protein
MSEEQIAAFNRSLEYIEQRMKATDNHVFKDSLLCDVVQRLSAMCPESTRIIVLRTLLVFNGYAEEEVAS